MPKSKKSKKYEKTIETSAAEEDTVTPVTHVDDKSSKPGKYVALSTTSEMADATIKAPTFDGKSDAYTFLKQFEKYIQYRGVEADPDRQLRLFTVLLKDSAGDWIDSLPDVEKNTFSALKASFEKRYLSPESVRIKCAKELFTKRQGSDTADDYITSMRKLAVRINATDDILKYAIMNGLQADIAVFVAQQQPDTIEDVIQAARLAEVTVQRDRGDSDLILQQLADMKEEMRRMRLEHQSTANIQPKSPTPDRRTVSFANETANHTTSSQRGGRFGGRTFHPPRRQNNGQMHQAQYESQQQQPLVSDNSQLCTRCGRFHFDIRQCPAWNKTCYRCNKRGHFASCCMSVARPQQQNSTY
jgi:hypothetical protein